MQNSLTIYLENHNFKKQLKRLEKKLKNKRIIIYGVGSLFQTVIKNYDLSKLNIVALSDRSIDCKKDYLGYKTCPPAQINNSSTECILVSTINYVDIIEDLEKKLGKNVKIYPLVKKTPTEIWKEIWG